jgi:tetratricopeptide (TPR) repeat protein
LPLSAPAPVIEPDRIIGFEIASCSQAVNRDPTNPLSWFNRGRAYLNAEKYSQAVDDFSRAIELGHMAAYVERAIAKGKERPHSFFEPLPDYDVIIEAFRKRPEPALRESAARAMLYRANILRDERFRRAAKDYSKVFAAYAEIHNLFESATEPLVLKVVGSALLEEGLLYSKLGKQKNAIESYTKIVNRFDTKRESALIEHAARALNNVGVSLSAGRFFRRRKQAIEAYAEVQKRFSEVSDPVVRATVACSLVNKAIIQTSAHEKFVTLDQALSLDDESPHVQRELVRAYMVKAEMFEEGGDSKKAAALLDEVMSRFGKGTDAELKVFIGGPYFTKLVC